MRFHRSELSFLLMLTLILAAGLFAFVSLQTMNSASMEAYSEVLGVLNLFAVIALGLIGLAAIIGVAFVLPAIRSHVKKETSLQSMTESLSARSATLEHEALTDGLTGMHNRR